MARTVRTDATMAEAMGADFVLGTCTREQYLAANQPRAIDPNRREHRYGLGNGRGLKRRAGWSA